MSADHSNKAGNRGTEAMASLLSEWSSRYRKALLNFFRRRMSRAADHEDLVQEVFLRLAKRSDLHDIRDTDRYIFQSAANVLKDWRRRQTTHAANAHDPIDDDLPDVGFSPERVLLGREDLSQLVLAVKMMPQRTQTIFLLYHLEQKTHAEIGRALGIAIRTVEDHMARANEHLLKVLRGRS